MLLTAVLRRPHGDALAGLDAHPIAPLLGYAVFRVANIFLAIWNDVHFRFRMASRLRINLEPDPRASRSHRRPWVDGDAITRFRRTSSSSRRH